MMNKLDGPFMVFKNTNESTGKYKVGIKKITDVLYKDDGQKILRDKSVPLTGMIWRRKIGDGYIVIEVMGEFINQHKAIVYAQSLADQYKDDDQFVDIIIGFNKNNKRRIRYSVYNIDDNTFDSIDDVCTHYGVQIDDAMALWRGDLHKNKTKGDK